MHAIEKELVKLTGFKAPRKYKDRQDYLAAIVNAVNKLADEKFDELGEEAVAWFNASVQAANGKKDLPDFDEAEAAPADDTETEEEADGDVEGTEAEDEEAGVDDADSDAGAEDEKPAKAKATKGQKPIKAAKPEAKPEKKEKTPPRRTVGHLENLKLSRFGAVEGSQTAQALDLFARPDGASMSEVKEAIGGTYYNALKKAVEQGHRMEKDGHKITLTHKDDVGKKVVKQEKPAKADKVPKKSKK